MFRFVRQGASTLAIVATTSSFAFAQTTPPASAPASGGVTEAVAPAEPVNAASVPVYPAAAPLKVEASNGSTIKLGVLVQAQYQGIDSATLSGWSQNLYLRRARILLGGTLFGAFDYFIDTDFANLFLPAPGTDAMGNATYTKATPGMNLQDVFVTWKPMHDLLKIDVGYMLPPLAHNALQGAGTLYGWDYFANSFNHSNAFGASAPPTGRDVGVQARGLLLDGHLEYRGGFFQGLRQAPTATQVGARNFFRFAARVQYNLFDAEPGFFYAGTYFGAKKILSFGLSGDIQNDYKYVAGDVFADLPIGPGVLTGQANLAHWDGDGFVALPKQTAVMAEAGFLLPAVQVSPIVRLEYLSARNAADTATIDTTKFSLGGAFWPYGHNVNLKAFYTRTSSSGSGTNQLNVQFQVYYF